MLFSPGQFKKNYEKNFFKKQQFSVKSQVLTFFLVSLICSNITMLHVAVPEIWSIV